jgi:hypothetical protein
MRGTVLAAAAGILMFQTIARAVLITYTEQLTATGGLDTTAFRNALVTLTFEGNTANVTNPSAGIFNNVVGVATVDIAGISGTARSTDEIGAFANRNINAAGARTLRSICLSRTQPM